MTTPNSSMTGSIQLQAIINSQRTDAISTATDPVNTIDRKVLSFGSVAPLVNLTHRKEYTVVNGAPQQIDLTALTDAFGNSIAFAKVLYFILINNGTKAIQVGATGDNAELPSIGQVTALKATVAAAGGLLYAADVAGVTVDGTHKLLTFTNAVSGSAVFDLYIVGISA